MFFVYVDFADDGRPFYVGKGMQQRVKALSRNKFHDSVAKKHGCRREVMLETSFEFEALNREIRLIAELHTFVDDPHGNGIGTNFTTGGDGLCGHRRSPEVRAKIAAGNRGLKRDEGFIERNKKAQKLAQTTPDVIAKKRASMSTPAMKNRVGSANRDHWVRRRAAHTCERCGVQGHYRVACAASLYDLLATRWEKAHQDPGSRD